MFIILIDELLFFTDLFLYKDPCALISLHVDNIIIIKFFYITIYVLPDNECV